MLDLLQLWNKSVSVDGVEVIEIPADYFESIGVDTDLKTPFRAFHDMLRGMVVAKTPVALRLETVGGRTQLFYLTWGSETNISSYMRTLTENARGHLPEFKIQTASSLGNPAIGEEVHVISAYLQGEPLSFANDQQRADCLTVLSEVLQGYENGIFQVFAKPHTPKKSKLKSLEQQYQRELESSQRTISTAKTSFLTPDAQESRVRIDPDAMRRAERTQREIKRYSSRFLCEVTVVATCWHQDKKIAERNARRLIEVLMSALTPADREYDFELKVRKKKSEGSRLLSGIPVGKSTLLTPDEAAVYFIIPQCDIGIKVSKREPFSTSSGGNEVPDAIPEASTPIPERISHYPRHAPTNAPRSWKWDVERMILLGHPLRNGELQRNNPSGLVPKVLASHLGVYGNTGYGKTTTSLSIVAQAYRWGVVPTIIVPDKVEDWRVLRDLFPEFRIFTAGNPEIAPLRFNIWNPPPGVPVGKYIDRMTDVHTAALPTDGVISMHFDDVFDTMYETCGWSRLGNVRGRPIMLPDLYLAAQKVAERHLKYGGDMKQDFFGALDARVRSMLRNPVLVDMYNTTSGLTIPELLAHPTIIEMRDLSAEDRTLLTGIITVGISEYLTANPSRSIKHLLVLEEAHHFLKRFDPSGGYAEPTAKQLARDNIVEMFRTQRGKGLGLLFTDQLPGSMTPEVVKLHSNVIIHRLTDEAERVLVGRQALCSDRQIEHIGGMGVGETVVRLMVDSTPRNVQILPLDYHLTSPLPSRVWTDEMVREAMLPLFGANPALSVSEQLSPEFVAVLKGETPQGSVASVEDTVERPQDLHDIPEIVNSPVFATEYLKRIRPAVSGDTEPLVNFLQVVALRFTSLDPREYTQELLLHAAGVHQVPQDAATLARLLLALRESDMVV